MNVLNGPTVHHSQGSRYNTISRHSHWPPCTCTIPYIALTKNSYEYSLSKYQVLYIILCVFLTRIWISSPKFEIHSVAPGTAICYCSATFLKMWPLANVDHSDQILKEILNLITKISNLLCSSCYSHFLLFSHITGNVTHTKCRWTIYHSDHIFKEIQNLIVCSGQQDEYKEFPALSISC